MQLLKTQPSIIVFFILVSFCIPKSFASDNGLLNAMEKELNRSVHKLGGTGSAPLYYLAYRVNDLEWFDLTAESGAVEALVCPAHYRYLDIDLRVGDRHRDNTHKLRGKESFGSSSDKRFRLPIEDNESAIRTALWEATDAAFKQAQQNYSGVAANIDVKSQEEDRSDDFSVESAQKYSGDHVELKIDRTLWEGRLRRLSAVFKQFAHLQNPTVHFAATGTKRFLVNSEGTKIRDEIANYRISFYADTIADDGMKLWLYDDVEVTRLSDLPDENKLEQMALKLAKSVEELRTAPAAEPYAGPAILRSRAASVFFHETFGHRMEGHRQKDMSEGRTFTKRIGQQVMPTFISVTDDPTTDMLGGRRLNGYYRYDDEGVPAQKVVLVQNGILKNFLMGRSPIAGFKKSNGHGRCSTGHVPVARQGNLIVESSVRVPYEKLREMLLEEVKKQGKPYGLIFDQIAGGFTMTNTTMPQLYKLQPLKVTRVFVDGRPDQLLRGVNLVGTPIASLEQIVNASDDDDTFNGTCGAESGWVPVSASSPSLLVRTIEVERQRNTQEKLPILPPPNQDPEYKSLSGAEFVAPAGATNVLQPLKGDR
jgi:TldD protein